MLIKNALIRRAREKHTPQTGRAVGAPRGDQGAPDGGSAPASPRGGLRLLSGALAGQRYRYLLSVSYGVAQKTFSYKEGIMLMVI